MSFSGSEVTDKGLARGWDPTKQDQASQRELRNLQILEAALFRPFAWKPHDSLRLKYAYYGGYVDTGAAWALVADGDVTLADDAMNYIERSPAGAVSVNQSGFTYPSMIPMAIIRTDDGEHIASSYIDARPDIGESKVSGGGATTFAMIIGQILDAQVPASAVVQHQAALSILFSQLVGVATRSQLPSEIAYEDEANVFTLIQKFLSGILVDTIDECTPGAGVTIEGVLIKDGEIVGEGSSGSPSTSRQLRQYELAHATDPHKGIFGVYNCR